ncbi:alanine--glyoxylate aminotransferase 2, mitochondrial-like isoform X2 [Ptychodera flava]
MPPTDFKPDKYTGITFEEAMKVRKERLTPSLMTYYQKPIMFVQGHGQWLYDERGRRYLDLFAGINTVSCGHCHPKVVAALEKQMKTLWHTSNIYIHPKIHEYVTKLTDKLPGDLKVAYIVNSGSEANDLAMLLARLHTGSFDIISLRSAYHGGSPYLQGLTALQTWNYSFARGFGIHNSMNADVFRGPYGGAHCRDSPVQTIRSCDCPSGQCQANDKYVHQVEDLLNHSCPKSIAGIFIEPIQGAGGINQYPKDFVKGAYTVARKKGALCIADEVQTGFGRMGSHYWGFETHGVMPDIVTMAKGIGNGFPLAAVVTTPAIAKCLTEALHFNTFGGNPLACAVGSAVIDVIEEEKLQENAEVIGTYLMKELEKLRDEFEVLGDVRGKGLMIGIDLVTDKESRSPLPGPDVTEILEETKDMGILLGRAGLSGNVLRIKPPMCITKADADFAVDVMRRALVNHTKRKPFYQQNAPNKRIVTKRKVDMYVKP